MGNCWAIIAYKWLWCIRNTQRNNNKNTCIYAYIHRQEDETNSTNWRNDFIFTVCTIRIHYTQHLSVASRSLLDIWLHLLSLLMILFFFFLFLFSYLLCDVPYKLMFAHNCHTMNTCAREVWYTISSEFKLFSLLMLRLFFDGFFFVSKFFTKFICIDRHIYVSCLSSSFKFLNDSHRRSSHRESLWYLISQYKLNIH